MPVYFNETSKTWYCKFYYHNYSGQSKQKKKSGFKFQRDAREWERSFIRKHEGHPDMLFSELYDLYMNDMEQRLRKSTLLTKRHLIETKILPYFKNMVLSNITAGTVRSWQNMIRGQKTPANTAYSETYLKLMNTQLSAMFNYAIRYYHFTENPCLAAGSMGKNQAAAMSFWTFDEFHRFLNYFPADHMMYLVFSILYYTGMRIGEFMALTYEDIQLDRGIVSISKSYKRIRKSDYISPPKTQKSNRVIALPHFLTRQMSEYISRQTVYATADRIFPSVTPYYIRKYMEEACAAENIPRIRIHDLRHSHASLLIEMGISPLLIAERLGHENIETTLNTYSHLYPDKQQELAKKLEILHDAKADQM